MVIFYFNYFCRWREKHLWSCSIMLRTLDGCLIIYCLRYQWATMPCHVTQVLQQHAENKVITYKFPACNLHWLLCSFVVWTFFLNDLTYSKKNWIRIQKAVECSILNTVPIVYKCNEIILLLYQQIWNVHCVHHEKIFKKPLNHKWGNLFK